MIKKLTVLIILSLLLSCNKNNVYFKFKDLPNNKWHKDSILKFVYIAKDTINRNNIYLNLRNDKNYEFSNLFLITEVNFPDKTKIIDTLEYEMTNEKGEFLGSGFSDTKENKLEFKNNIKFPNKGDYTFKIQHAVRKIGKEKGIVELNGIIDVGLEIEKIPTNSK